MSIPSEKHLLAFLQDHQEPVLQRDLGKAFGVKGEDRRRFRSLLSDLVRSGKLHKKGKSYSYPSKKGASYRTVLITEKDEEAFLGVSVSQGQPSQKQLSYLIFDTKGQLEIGQKALVRLDQAPCSSAEGSSQVAQLVRVLKAPTTTRLIGVYLALGEQGLLQPLSKKDRREIPILPSETLNPQEGDLIEADICEEGRHRVTARLKRILHRGQGLGLQASELAILEHDLPRTFSEEALKQAQNAKRPTLGKRQDLRPLPLVTIDDQDAKDFDDAVFAEEDTSPDNPKGWRLWVAIADVAHYVPQHSPLDQEAHERGNSVYFPDKVLPMLPEALSNDLCSLKPDVDRACLAVSMRITKTGKLLDHKFTRGLMRSAKRLTYSQVQRALDQGPDEHIPASFLKDVIEPLHGAYLALKKGRQYRGALDLNIDEYKLRLDEKGYVQSVETKKRLSSHQLIEEFMVLANVAAAKTLNDAGFLCLFRVHDQPTPEKVDTLRNFLKLLSVDFKKGQKISPKLFNALLKKVVGNPHEQAVNELVLRAQAQAVYTPENIGHFGLGLARYAHFTSPIRRYADLLIHRALLHHLDGGSPKDFPYSQNQFSDIGDHLSITERRAAKAERDSKDRLISHYLASHEDEVFEGRLSGLSDKGLFVTLLESGGDAFLPLRLLPHDYYRHDMKRQALVGQRTKRSFQLGDRLNVRIIETNPITGNLIVGLEQTPKQTRRKRSRSPKTSPRKRQKSG